jgi:hypothetical protein
MSLAAPARSLAPWVAACAALAIAAGCVGAALGAAAIGIVPAPFSRGSITEAAEIFAANLRIATIVGLAAWVATWPPRWRPPSQLLAGIPAAIALLNAAVVGAVLGALGTRAIARALPHAPLELAGFGAAYFALAWALRGELTARRAVSLSALCLVCLALGAAVESFVSGELR